MPKWIKKTEKFVDKIVDIQQFLSNMFLIFIMLIISLDVLGRNILNKPLKGTYELTELGAALLVFFALAITHRVGDHITIDFVVERFSEKAQNIIKGIIDIVIAIILVVMSVQIFDNGLRMMDRSSTTTDLSIPVYPFLFIITFTLIIFALTAIFKAIHYFGSVVNKNES